MRLCDEGCVPSRMVDEPWLIDVDVVATYQRGRDRLRSAAREAAITSERGRRARSTAAANNA
jgi:hypothetical protein